MLPLRDDQPSESKPLITSALIGANVLVFLYQLGLDERQTHALLQHAALLPSQLVGAVEHGTELEISSAAATLITSQFLHGGVLHLVLNLWALWIFGDNVEDRLGALRYLVFYVACGIAAGLWHVAASPGSEIPVVGASGAISGVMGAYVVLYPRARVVTLVPVLFYPLLLSVPAVLFLGLWFAMQLLSGLAETRGAAQQGGVAWWAHIGGFVAGIALLAVLVPKRRRHARGD